MSGFLQALQVLGSVLSTKMTGDTATHMRFVLILLLGLSLLGFFMQAEGGLP